jgi:hypothetical protein
VEPGKIGLHSLLGQTILTSDIALTHCLFAKQAEAITDDLCLFVFEIATADEEKFLDERSCFVVFDLVD